MGKATENAENVRHSTVFRDLAQHLEREAQRFGELGYPTWEGHLLEDAEALLKRAERLAQREPPLPSIESLAGIDLGFKSAESELERLRQREVSCRECGEPVERDDVVFHEECLDPAVIAARAALEQS